MEKETIKIMKATHEGELKFGDMTISCYVLENGKRVLSQRSTASAFGMSLSAVTYVVDGVTKIPSFLSAAGLRPFISKELVVQVNNPILLAPKREL